MKRLKEEELSAFIMLITGKSDPRLQGAGLAAESQSALQGRLTKWSYSKCPSSDSRFDVALSLNMLDNSSDYITQTNICLLQCTFM